MTNDKFVRAQSEAPSSIEIHIDELVLHGFAPSERYAIGEMLEHELHHIVQERGLSFTHDVEVARVNLGMVNLSVNAQPHHVGAQIGQAVYRGMGTIHE